MADIILKLINAVAALRFAEPCSEMPVCLGLQEQELLRGQTHFHTYTLCESESLFH